MNVFAAFKGFNPAMIAGIFLAMVVPFAVVYLIFWVRARRRPSPSALRAIIVDPTTKTVEETKTIKVSEGLYIAPTDPPKILVLSQSPEEAVYSSERGKVVFCRVKGWRLVPVNIAGAIDVSVVQDAMGIRLDASIRNVSALLAEMLEASKDVRKEIKLTPTISIALCANPSDVVSEYYLRSVEKMVDMESHFLESIKQSENVSRMIEAMTKYAGARMKWLAYLIPLIAVVGILMVIFMALR